VSGGLNPSSKELNRRSRDPDKNSRQHRELKHMATVISPLTRLQTLS
jgi:hypothetical protein